MKTNLASFTGRRSRILATLALLSSIALVVQAGHRWS
jgi:hypothetical protein